MVKTLGELAVVIGELEEGRVADTDTTTTTILELMAKTTVRTTAETTEERGTRWSNCNCTVIFPHNS